MWSKAYEGAGARFSEHTEHPPVSIIVRQHAREEETKFFLSPVTLATGCSLSQETRRDRIYSPGHSKSQCLHTARAPSSPAPRLSMQKLGAVVKGKWACYRKSHGSDRVVRTTEGRGLFAWRCTPPAPGASVPAARPAPAGTGSAAARPAWHCGHCA